MNEATDAPAVEAPSGPIVNQRLTVTLPCKLTKAEHLERAQSLAKILGDIDDMELAHDEQKRAMKDEKANLQAALAAVYRVVLSGHEQRVVEVEDRLNLATQKMERWRLDTNEKMSERALSDEERQTSFV